MRLVSYVHTQGPSYGVLKGGVILDLVQHLTEAPPTLKSVLGQIDIIERAASQFEANIPLTAVELLPPIPDPQRIICIGRNYKSAMRKLGLEFPAYPIIFTRFADSQVGHGQSLIRPRVSDQFDFEGEMAFVIGREGRHVKLADALDHVAGYACYNDGSIRDYQRHTNQDSPGKNFWHSGAFGPWITTADEVPDPTVLKVTTRLNGQVMQEGIASDLLFGVAEIIEYLSAIFPLQSGDIVATGTPLGVGLTREPPLWLEAGDTIEVEIPQIGILANTVIDEC